MTILGSMHRVGAAKDQASPMPGHSAASEGPIPERLMADEVLDSMHLCQASGMLCCPVSLVLKRCPLGLRTNPDGPAWSVSGAHRSLPQKSSNAWSTPDNRFDSMHLRQASGMLCCPVSLVL